MLTWWMWRKKMKKKRVKYNFCYVLFHVFLFCVSSVLKNNLLILSKSNQTNKWTNPTKTKRNKNKIKQENPVLFHFPFFLFSIINIWWTNHITSLVLKSKNWNKFNVRYRLRRYYFWNINVFHCFRSFSFEQFRVLKST